VSSGLDAIASDPAAPLVSNVAASGSGPLGYRVRPVADDAVASLSASLGLRSVTARCLAGRGITDGTLARSFLAPRLGDLRAPVGLAGLPSAVERLARAAQRGERVGTFGDYDVDGVTTCALLSWALGAMGASVVPRVARRDAGYGFGEGELAALAAAGCTLIVTGDCGTSDVVALAAARARGIDVVVIDHHTVPAAAELAAHPAYALINPFRADSTFPFQGMASVGLAFYVMQAVRRRLRELGAFRTRPEPDLRDALDLVALGTVADLVPLSRENRILTAHGLRLLAERRRPGLAALLAVAGVAPGEAIDERTVGWKLGPRLNAPGRLGDAAPALELLLCRDAGRAHALAGEIEQLNQTRRTEQDRVLAEAEQLIDRDGDPGPAVVVAGRGWPSGVVGIVAAKLVERWRRPAFVIAIGADGVGVGSARTHDGVDVHRALGEAAAQVEVRRFGGHAAAVGVTVDEARLPALREALGRAVEAQCRGAAGGWGVADAEVALAEVDLGLAEELAGLAPFGKGNEAPLLVGRGLVVRDSRRVGGGGHLKLTLGDDATGARVSAIGFGLGERDPGVGARIDVAFTPAVSTFRGDRKVELGVRDLAVS
jgi:single-stranded-DNA-specific exonuclease